MKKTNRFLFILLLIISLFLVTGCAFNNETSTTITNTNKEETTLSSETTKNSEISTTIKETPRFKEGYNPTTFSNVTYNSIDIVDGLTLYTYTVTKANGQITVIQELEADLNKVNIVAGTKDNKSISFNYSKTTPYNAGIAYTNDTNKKVFATLNADFFGSMCVNAFVKDGFIIKDSHNDNNNYDYRDTKSDVPASAPMLFGVKGNTAQVAPIKNYEGDITVANIKRSLIRSKLTYLIESGIKTIETSDSFKLVNSTLYLAQNDMYAIVDVSKGAKEVEVLDLKIANAKETLNPLDEGKAYIYSSKDDDNGISFLNRLSVGSKVKLSVKSEDGLWDNYDTILGCRQALVINGEIPETVKLENTNGAQSGDIPRSAVGINVDGKVCIYAVESMYYGKKNSEDDPHGCDINLLSEFMFYNNIVSGANFDGGGSTQLICNINSTNTVIVRSSDTGSRELNSTRSVMNVIMVTEK